MSRPSPRRQWRQLARAPRHAGSLSRHPVDAALRWLDAGASAPLSRIAPLPMLCAAAREGTGGPSSAALQPRLQQLRALLTAWSRRRQSWPLQWKRDLKALWNLAGVPWEREPQAWRAPRRGGSFAALRSLAEHLCCSYTVPDVLIQILFQTPAPQTDRMAQLIRYLGQGGSLVRAVRGRRLPIPLTRKACHLFLALRGRHPLMYALRLAQAQAAGAPLPVARAIARTRELRQLTRHEKWWAQTIDWCARQKDVQPGFVGRTLGFLFRQWRDGESDGPGGSSFVQIHQRMQRWYEAQRRERERLARLQREATLRLRVRVPDLPGLDPAERDWRVLPLRSGVAYYREAQAHQHCVFTFYLRQAKLGQSACFSLQRRLPEPDPQGRTWKRRITLELRLATMSLNQALGKANRGCTPEEWAIVSAWAERSGVVISPGCIGRPRSAG